MCIAGYSIKFGFNIQRLLFALSNTGCCLSVDVAVLSACTVLHRARKPVAMLLIPSLQSYARPRD